MRSLIFKIVFLLWTSICCILVAPFLFFPGRFFFSKLVAKLWSVGTKYLLLLCCRISHKVIGTENLPTDGPYILASKHQSVWETCLYLHIFNIPVFVHKKELHKLPIFGKVLKSLNYIAVDRGAGASALKQMVTQVVDRLEKGRKIVIFPEGTRTPIGKKPKYRSGIASVYHNQNVKVPIIPVALNSGCFWSKEEKKPGQIIVNILPPIKTGMNKEEFMKMLEETIEGESNKLRPPM